jgi:hypothetical protein
MELRNHAIVLREGDPTKAASAMHTPCVARLSHQRTGFASVDVGRTPQKRRDTDSIACRIVKWSVSRDGGDPQHISVCIRQHQCERVIVTRVTVNN